MTDADRDSFKIALAFWNHSGAAKMTREQQINEGDNMCGKIVETHEDVQDFARTHGQPHQRVETPDGPLFVWNGRQLGKGRARGTLFLMPAAAASMFTGG